MKKSGSITNGNMWLNWLSVFSRQDQSVPVLKYGLEIHHFSYRIEKPHCGQCSDNRDQNQKASAECVYSC
jgi:hypothetical protein